MTIHPAKKQDIPQVVKVHLDAFPGFFLSVLGPGFLRQLYLGFLSHPQSQLLCAYDEQGQVLGFVAWSNDLSGFYSWLIKRKLPAFAFYALGALIKRPTALMRLVRALLKPGESKREEAYAELSSIGVDPKAGGQGVGRALIEAVKNAVDYQQNAYLKLETDAKDNESVNAFYARNGFVLARQYETREGRLMNEYRFRPENSEAFTP